MLEHVNNADAQKIAMVLLGTFGNISQSIDIMKTRLNIDSVDKLCNIFHNDLQMFKCDHNANIGVQFDKKNSNGIKNIDNKFGTHLREIHLNGVIPHWHSPARVLDVLDEFGLRKNVQCYQVDWYHPFYFQGPGKVPAPVGVHHKLILDRILINDHDKHPLLKKIVIKLTDDRFLRQFAQLLIYFNGNYEQLFDATHRELKNLSVIEIEWKKVKHTDDDKITHDRVTNHPIFNVNKNKQYGVNDKRIEIYKVGHTIESFGNIYASVIDWFQKIESQYVSRQQEKKQRAFKRRVAIHL